MAKYKLNTKAFIEGNLLPEGTVFNIADEWQPGPHCEALDEAAEAALSTYYAKYPDATLHPVEQLPNTLGLEVVAVEPKGQEPEVDLTAGGTKAVEPGLANGGQAKATK